MNKNISGKNKICFWIIGIISFILILGIAFFVYVQDFYHATDYAKECLVSVSGEYRVEQTSDNCIVFYPENDSDLGLGFVFYPGGKVEYTAYAPLLCQLSKRGITCFLLKVPCNLAILDTDAAKEIKANDYPDIDKWFIGGHSLGGLAASMYLSDSKEDYEGIILMGAYSTKDLSSLALSCLTIYGSQDQVMNKEQYLDCKGNYGSDYTEYVIDGGCHAYFGSYGPQNGDGSPNLSDKEQQEITADVIAEWIN